MPNPARFLRTPKKVPIRTEFQAGTVGKLRSRNDLNAMSRRSSSDLVSPSSFLRSSSAFRLAGLRIGSQRLPFRSRTPFASGGSVLLVIVGCRLFISLHPCPKQLTPPSPGSQSHREEDIGLALTRAVNNHAQRFSHSIAGKYEMTGKVKPNQISANWSIRADFGQSGAVLASPQ
jgi:hypothetical protein